MDDVQQIVNDIKLKNWDSKPHDRAEEIARNHPELLGSLFRGVIDEVPSGIGFPRYLFSRLSETDVQGLVEYAFESLEKNSSNRSAQDMFYHVSIELPYLLHPHLNRMLEIAPNPISFYRNWAWRDSGSQHIGTLQQIIDKKESSDAERAKAWEALLETRDPHALQLARSKYESGAVMLPYSLDVYLAEVGFELQEGAFIQLYKTPWLHIVFDPAYFVRSGFPHPTWQPNDILPGVFRFGGWGKTRCLNCSERLHHIITLDVLPDWLGISELSSLTLETCLSCLGWVHQPLYYHHSGNGIPTQIAYDGSPSTPEFVDGPFTETSVRLGRTSSRFKWQAVHLSEQNLNRVGGHPAWVQGAEYPACQTCKNTMSFLIQLDEDYPTPHSKEWMWGAGGLCYIFWCNNCQNSAFLWQCT